MLSFISDIIVTKCSIKAIKSLWVSLSISSEQREEEEVPVQGLQGGGQVLHDAPEGPEEVQDGQVCHQVLQEVNCQVPADLVMSPATAHALCDAGAPLTSLPATRTTLTPHDCMFA